MSSNTKLKLAGQTTKLSLKKEDKQKEDHPADLNYYQDGSFFHIPTDDILPDPDQPRKYFDPEALDELTLSIKDKGVLQPIIVRRNEDNGRFYIVAGERRYRATLKAGLQKIPSIITSGDPLEISIIENVQRKNLNPVEEAEAFERLLKKHNYTQEKLAFVVGKAKQTVSEILSLNKLSESIKAQCRESDSYSRRVLIEVARQNTEEEMNSLFEQIKDGHLKRNKVRAIIRTEPQKKRTPASIAYDKTQALSAYLKKINITTVEQKEKAFLLSALSDLKQSISSILGEE